MQRLSAIRLKDGRKVFQILEAKKKNMLHIIWHKINHGKAQKCEINDLIIHDNFVEWQITPEISLNNKTIKL
jgi:hypothetical protein